MKGDAGKDLLEKLGENVGNSPNASDKTKEEAGAIKGDANTDPKESEEAKKEDGKKDTANTGDSGNKQTANNNTPNNSASNNTGNNASKPTGGNTQNNKPSKPAEQPKPAHQHSWKDHVATKTEWIPNIVTVDDYAEQQVPVGTAWQCNCGAQILGNADEHIMNHILNGEDDGGRNVPIYETQTVKVGSHTEDRGSYQTTSYVDYQYCDCGAKR